MARKMKKKPQTNQRVARFEKELATLLQTNQYSDIALFLKSDDFKKITTPQSQRRDRSLKTNKFSNDMKARCLSKVDTIASKLCRKIGLKSSKAKIRQRASSPTANKPSDKEKDANDQAAASKARSEDAQGVSRSEDDQGIPDAGTLFGFDNVTASLCYAASGLQLLMRMNVLVDGLTGLEPSLPAEGLTKWLVQLTRARREADKKGGNKIFLALLDSLGKLRPDWSDLTQTQDSAEFIEVVLTECQTELRCASLPNTINTLFNVETECQGCGLLQSSEGLIKYSSLQEHETRTSSVILQDVLAEGFGNCFICNSGCRATAFPRYFIVRLNRFDSSFNQMKGARMTLQRNSHVDAGNLHGDYYLQGGVLYYPRLKSVDHYKSIIWQPEVLSYVQFDDDEVSLINEESAMRLMSTKCSVLLFELIPEK